MKCEVCGENEANLHFTSVINGEIKEQHICQSCAYKGEAVDITDPFSLHKIFMNLIDELQGDIDTDVDLVCGECGLEYKEFRQIGKFGCTNCYNAFSQKLDPLFKGIQGDNIHRGKIPDDKILEISLEREIRDLEAKLEEVVKLEEYEEAAVIRDKIKELNNSCMTDTSEKKLEDESSDSAETGNLKIENEEDNNG